MFISIKDNLVRFAVVLGAGLIIVEVFSLMILFGVMLLMKFGYIQGVY